jgi:fatty-acyl-CoA synthase
MMDMPLSTQMILERGARLFAQSCVLTFDGLQFQSSPFSTVALRAARLASALQHLGISTGQRVATFCWNHQAHLEAYLAVPSMGAVLHTLNVRLLPAQIAALIAHADDRVLIIDESLLPLIHDQLAQVTTLSHIVVVGRGAAATLGHAQVVDYETLLERARPIARWPDLEERSAAALCYTTGTTGAPKGVLYSHRSIYLHSVASMAADSFGIREADKLLVLPSMFHATAWGLPYSGWMAGADLLLPDSYLKTPSLRAMIEQERPTFTALVPTIINDLLQSNETDRIDMSSFRVLLCGGSAVSPALIRAVHSHWGIPVLQGWGMTESGPMCVLSHPPRDSTSEEAFQWRAKSGRPVPGMTVRLVDAEDRPVAEDGRSVGELQLSGPWVTGSYYRGESAASFTSDGWLRTGDVGTIDPRGYVQVTDRQKDMIKSGGEWVSSLDLENQLLEHPAVFQAAVIGIPDPRWEERPLAFIVLQPDAAAGGEELRDFLSGRVARFSLPERWVFVRELPRTSVGKIDKRELRRLHAEGRFDIVSTRKRPPTP